MVIEAISRSRFWPETCIFVIEDDPQSGYDHVDGHRTVALAIGQLPEGQREVLLLAHYEQMPLAEIAEVMQLELGAVKSRLQRARAGLRETLAAYAPNLEGQP